MRPDVEQILQETGSRYPALLPVLPDLRLACEMLIAAFAEGGQLLLCGNGGSAADSEHIAGELLKGYLLRRPVPLSDKAKIRALLEGLADDRETDEMLDRLQLGLPRRAAGQPGGDHFRRSPTTRAPTLSTRSRFWRLAGRATFCWASAHPVGRRIFCRPCVWPAGLACGPSP